MHHPELAGDSASARKMAQAANCPRRATANTAGGSSAVLTSSSGGASLSSNLMPTEDYKPSALIQPLPTAASSLGTPHPPPPHSLNILSQSSLLPPGMPSSGAQIKKKSGFQITSVTPAQISVSTNNSITEDTESCDDLDESHTEDLSSSEILDVSLSRANDAAGPERSSSEDTLNNLHDAETPGAVSPNQPPLLPQTHGTMVNGAVHHHHTHHHHQLHAAPSGNAHPASSAPSGTQSGILGNVIMSTVTPNPGALPIVDQKMPSNVVGMVDNSTAGSVAVGQPFPAAAPGMSTGMASATSGATVSVKPLTSNVNNLNPSVPVLGGISTTSSGVALSTGLTNTNNQNVNLMRQQSSSISSAITITTGTPASAVIGSSSGSHMGITDVTQPSSAAPASNAQPQQTPMPAPHTTSSRFRVVKLDSTSEPFKKGRWTCTEYYDKEGPGPGSSENAPSTRTVESIRQFLPDNSERETVSVSSVSSSVSTLSHYSEGVASGDVGGSSAVQQSFPPPAQMPDYSMSANVSKPQMHPQKKANTATSVPGSSQQQAPINLGGLQTTTGHPSPAVLTQQLTYTQTAQLTPAQAVPGVTAQQMAYPPTPQPAAAAQVAPVHVSSLSQSQQIIQVAASGSTQALPHMSTSMTPVSVTGNGQVMPASQPPVGNLPAAVAQSVAQGILQSKQTSQMVQAPTGGVISQLVQSTGPGVVQQPSKGPQLPVQHSIEQQTPLSSQAIGAQFVPVTSSLPTSNVPHSIQSDPQASLVQNSSKDGGAQPAVSALYATLPSLMATQLEDAQRLLIQHQSLLTLPKLAAGECASQTGTSLAPEESGGVSALTASASLLKNLPVDGEEDG